MRAFAVCAADCGLACHELGPVMEAVIREVAPELVDGSSYKEIAAKLNMTSGQVNNVVAAIYRKLGIHGKTELKKFV